MSTGRSPLLMIDMLNNFYSLADDKVVNLGGGEVDEHTADDKVVNLGGGEVDEHTVIVGSSHGWVAMFNKRSLALFLWNPVSRRRINLPSIETLATDCVEKVIVSSSSPDAADCRVAMTYDLTSRLAFCCPGLSGEWIPIGNKTWPCDMSAERPCFRTYEGFAFSKNSLYCITKYGDVERWDLEDPRSPLIDWNNEEREWDSPLIDEYWFDDRAELALKYMVLEEQSQVFVVVRDIVQMDRDGSYAEFIEFNGEFPYKTVDFRVYKIDMDGGLPYLVESLDGLAIFVGNNYSFAMCASEFPELKPDSIYFTDANGTNPPLIVGDGYYHGGHDIGIFHCKNKTFSQRYFPCDIKDIRKLTPLWFTPTPTSLITSNL